MRATTVLSPSPTARSPPSWRRHSRSFRHPSTASPAGPRAAAPPTLPLWGGGDHRPPAAVRARPAARAKQPANPYAGRIFLGEERMIPEQHIADASRPFTGAEYIESLKDGREVYINGERVRDVTTHPGFRNSVRSLARLFAALHDPERQDVLTCPTDPGSARLPHP